MTTTTIYLENSDGIEFEALIKAKFVPFERGYRDSLGVPEEPDIDEHFEILESSIEGRDMDFDEMSEFLGGEISADEIERQVNEALFEQYNDDYECYLESRIP